MHEERQMAINKLLHYMCQKSVQQTLDSLRICYRGGIIGNDICKSVQKHIAAQLHVCIHFILKFLITIYHISVLYGIICSHTCMCT